MSVDEKTDYTHQFPVTGLKPATRYHLRVEARAAEGSPVVPGETGSFITPEPAEDSRINFEWEYPWCKLLFLVRGTTFRIHAPSLDVPGATAWGRRAMLRHERKLCGRTNALMGT